VAWQHATDILPLLFRTRYRQGKLRKSLANFALLTL
jgi:hypothetical protein